MYTLFAIVDYIYQRLNGTSPEVQHIQATPQETKNILDNHDADPYARGYKEGLADSNAPRAARYLPGDHLGADSETHAKAIDGYVNGYFH